MANAKKDANDVSTFLGTLQSDGITTINLAINPSNNGLKVIDATTGTASTRTTAPRDENSVHAWMAVSIADGVTRIPIAMDSSGNLLIQST